MTNEKLIATESKLRTVHKYKTAWCQHVEDAVQELVRRELERSQPKPVEAKEESTFEEDPHKRCRKNHPSGYRFCTRQKGHAGDHHEHSMMDGTFLASWPNESPAPPKRDYGREKAEKMVAPLPDSETFSGGEMVRMHGMGMDFKARCPYASWMVDFLAGVASAARADGIEEAAKALQLCGLHMKAEDVRELK